MRTPAAGARHHLQKKGKYMRLLAETGEVYEAIITTEHYTLRLY